MLSINKFLLLDERNQLWMGIALLALVGVAVFFPVVNFQFLSDDWDLVYHADRYQSFTDRFVLNDHQTTEGYSYRPIVGIYLAVLRSLFGLNPAGFHAFFVLVHILNAVLVFFLAKGFLFFERSAGGVEKLHHGTSRLRSKSIVFVSFVAALIFLLLPAHAEAVFWISSGADVVATSFYLLSLLFFILLLSPRHSEIVRPVVNDSSVIGDSESRNEKQKQKDSFGFSFSFLDSSLKTGMTYYLSSIIFFGLGLLTKEIVVTLPIAILLLFFFESLYYKKRYVTEWRDRHMSRHIFFSTWKTTVPFFIIAGAYLFLRWNATGALFGYYGRPNVGVDVGQWVRMAADILSSFFVWGDTRLKLAEIFREQFHWLMVLLAFVTLYIGRHCEEASDEAISGSSCNNEIATLPPVARNDKSRNKLKTFSLLITLFIISLLPVLPLGFNPLSDEGERYGYLPSAFFVILIVYVIYHFVTRHSDESQNPEIKTHKKRSFYFSFLSGSQINPSTPLRTWFGMTQVISYVVFLVFIGYFLYGLNYKVCLWQRYQDINYQILNQLYQLNNGRKMIVVGLPDSYRGVPGFRNGIEEAYKLYYGENIDVVRIPVYTVDNSRVNIQCSNEAMKQCSNEFGYTVLDGYDPQIQNQVFLKTIDKSLRLTGEKEYEDEYVDVDFFRWHYNINRADGVTVKLKERLVEDIQSGKVSLVLFDGIRIVGVFSSL